MRQDSWPRFSGALSSDEQREFFVPFMHRADRERVRRRSGHISLQPLAVASKADASPVTEADRQTELALRRLIEQRYPHHACAARNSASAAAAPIAGCSIRSDGTRALHQPLLPVRIADRAGARRRGGVRSGARVHRSLRRRHCADRGTAAALALFSSRRQSAAGAGARVQPLARRHRAFELELGRARAERCGRHRSSGRGRPACTGPGGTASAISHSPPGAPT